MLTVFLEDFPICFLESSMSPLCRILSFILLWPLKLRTVLWCKSEDQTLHLERDLGLQQAERESPLSPSPCVLAHHAKSHVTPQIQ